MSEFFDYDPVTGITEFFEWDDENRCAVIRSVQDVSALLDRNRELRNSGATDIGIKNEWWHVASIPCVVQMELRKKGIDIFNPDQWNLLAKTIETDYPYLKTTGKRIV